MINSKATPGSTASFAARLGLAALLAFTVGAADAQFRGGFGQQEEEQDTTYEWTATFVSFDEGSSTIVVSADVASHAKLDNLDDFSEGDRLVLVWSGRMWASGIRELAANPELMPDTLSLPVEFVSAEDDGKTISFRVHAPDSAADVIATLQPGHLIKGVSPKMATDWNTSVESIRHYNDLG